jgi:hypothetical protein
MTVEEVEGEEEEEEEDFEGIWWNPLGMKSLYHLRDGGSKRIGPIVSRRHLPAGIAIVIVIEIILAVGEVGEVLIGRVPGDLRFLLCHRAVTIGDHPTGIATEAEVVAEGIAAAIGGEVVTGIVILCHREIENVGPASVAAVGGGVIARVPIQQHQYLPVAAARLLQFLRRFRRRHHQWKTMTLCQSLVMHKIRQLQRTTPIPRRRQFASPRVPILPLLTMLLLLPPCLVLLPLLRQPLLRHLRRRR